HQRDNQKLINTLIELRDLGNSVIVVEPDTDTILAADHILDMGPGAGVHGGMVVYNGSVTGILLGDRRIGIPTNTPQVLPLPVPCVGLLILPIRQTIGPGSTQRRSTTVVPRNPTVG
ncbi:MAG: hypothetical protein ACRCZ5_00105, partial [Burkholderiales bacterium]